MSETHRVPSKSHRVPSYPDPTKNDSEMYREDHVGVSILTVTMMRHANDPGKETERERRRER